MINVDLVPSYGIWLPATQLVATQMGWPKNGFPANKQYTIKRKHPTNNPKKA